MDTARAQSVAIQNVSYPGTALEVGETVGISISGGTPGSSVTVNINGTLYSVGTTDGSGNWSTTSSITSGFADTDWTEHWYVNGTETTPSNSDLLFAPTLPVFTYYGNYSGANCGGQFPGDETQGCGSNQPLHWVFSPIGWDSVSSQVSSYDVYYDTGLWNDVQSKISLVPAYTWAIYIYDASLDGYDGYTNIYGWDCGGGACYGYQDLCGGNCFDDSATKYAQIELDADNIDSDVTSMSAVFSFNSVFGGTVATISDETFAEEVLLHELGHALNLSHPSSTDTGRCSEVQSIMYDVPSVAYMCGIYGPTSSCDEGTVNSVYPTAPPACTPAETSDSCYETEEYACS